MPKKSKKSEEHPFVGAARRELAKQENKVREAKANLARVEKESKDGK